MATASAIDCPASEVPEWKVYIDTQMEQARSKWLLKEVERDRVHAAELQDRHALHQQLDRELAVLESGVAAQTESIRRLEKARTVHVLLWPLQNAEAN